MHRGILFCPAIPTHLHPKRSFDVLFCTPHETTASFSSKAVSCQRPAVGHAKPEKLIPASYYKCLLFFEKPENAPGKNTLWSSPSFSIMYVRTCYQALVIKSFIKELLISD